MSVNLPTASQVLDFTGWKQVRFLNLILITIPPAPGFELEIAVVVSQRIATESPRQPDSTLLSYIKGAIYLTLTEVTIIEVLLYLGDSTRNFFN